MCSSQALLATVEGWRSVDGGEESIINLIGWIVVRKHLSYFVSHSIALIAMAL